MTPAEKFELGCEVRARADILPTYRLLFAAALDRYNTKTGRCDPSSTTLAADIGVSINTARRALVVLEEHGLIRRIPRNGKTAQLMFTPPTAMGGATESDPSQKGRVPLPKGDVTPPTAMGAEPLTLEPKGKRHSGKWRGNGAQASPDAPDPRPSPEDRERAIAVWEEAKRRLKAKRL